MASGPDAEVSLVVDFSAAMESTFAELVIAFHDSLTAAQDAVGSRSELRHVDAVFETALPLLQGHLAVTESRGWSAGLSGAFVHGGNRYEANSGVGNCEIADLLVVVEVSRPPDAARTAILLQAKKPMEPPACPWRDGSGPAQFAFYEQMPEFTWRPASVARYYRGWPRKISCSEHSSWVESFPDARWGNTRAVFAALRHPRPWVVPPHEPMGEPALLAAVLADLVRFQVGHPFEKLSDSYPHPSELQWSAVIWDLLQSSLERAHYHETVPDREKTSMLQDEGPGGEGYDDMAAFIAERGIDGNELDLPPNDDDDPGGGVSIVRLVFTAIDG